LVVYDTMWRSTETMAKAIYDGLLNEGVCVQLKNLTTNHRSDMVTELLDAKALVLGSSTLNNNILPRMADFITYVKGLKPIGKIGAAFGSYGWSGEAVKAISDELAAMKVELLTPSIRHQFVPDHEALRQCRELGTKLGQAIKAAGCPAQAAAPLRFAPANLGTF